MGTKGQRLEKRIDFKASSPLSGKFKHSDASACPCLWRNASSMIPHNGSNDLFREDSS